MNLIDKIRSLLLKRNFLGIMSLLRFIFCLILCGVMTASAAAQGDSFENLLRANTFPIQIQNGRLSGKGAEIIEDSLDGVQFVALGEEHNKRAVHEFGDARTRKAEEETGRRGVEETGLC
jgi:hypothetical protein